MWERFVGVAVWRGGKWYVRRRVRRATQVPRTHRKAVIAGLLALVVIGVLAGQRQPADN
jgi:hypothetical protein